MSYGSVFWVLSVTATFFQVHTCLSFASGLMLVKSGVSAKIEHAYLFGYDAAYVAAVVCRRYCFSLLLSLRVLPSARRRILVVHPSSVPASRVMNERLVTKVTTKEYSRNDLRKIITAAKKSVNEGLSVNAPPLGAE